MKPAAKGPVLRSKMRFGALGTELFADPLEQNAVPLGQAPAVIGHFGLVVGPGRPWSALVGCRWGVSRYREATEKLRREKKPI